MSWNNVIPAWMLDENNRYWIEYTDGTITNFYRRDRNSAHEYFMSEGDHAVDFGRVVDNPEKKVKFSNE
jgi:hypothetical protein